MRGFDTPLVFCLEVVDLGTQDAVGTKYRRMESIGRSRWPDACTSISIDGDLMSWSWIACVSIFPLHQCFLLSDTSRYVDKRRHRRMVLNVNSIHK